MSRVRPRGEDQKQNYSSGLIVPQADEKRPGTGRVASAKFEDGLIKRGQLTLPRLLSLTAIAGFFVGAIYLGGVWLLAGYWVVTIGFCILLFLIAIDYGVEMEKVYPGNRNLEIDKSEAGNAAFNTKKLPELNNGQSVSAMKAQRRGNPRSNRRRF